MNRAPRDFLLDAEGSPLVVFHGTPLDHEEFDLDRHHTVGIHLGCKVQAVARLCKCETGWIISAHIQQGRIVEVRSIGGNLLDPFSESPSLTAFHLRARNVLNDEDMEALGFERLSLPIAHNIEWNPDSRRTMNRALLQRLRMRADIIKYANLNEPRDSIPREAYCVLANDHVHRVGKERYNRP